MPQQSILQKLDEALSRVRSLEREREEAFNRARGLEQEKDEALNRVRALEQETKELRGLIAESKAEEILRPPAAGQAPEDAKFATGSKGLQELVEDGAIRSGDLKRRYP
jgi:hypothetical protein